MVYESNLKSKVLTRFKFIHEQCNFKPEEEQIILEEVDN